MYLKIPNIVTLRQLKNDTHTLTQLENMEFWHQPTTLIIQNPVKKTVIVALFCVFFPCF